MQVTARGLHGTVGPTLIRQDTAPRPSQVVPSIAKKTASYGTALTLIGMREVVSAAHGPPHFRGGGVPCFQGSALARPPPPPCDCLTNCSQT